MNLFLLYAILGVVPVLILDGTAALVMLAVQFVSLLIGILIE